jgi:Leucine-rich repeat (LRR) protein
MGKMMGKWLLAVSILAMGCIATASCFGDSEDFGPCLPLDIYEDSLRETILAEAELPFSTVESVLAAQRLPTGVRSVELIAATGTILDIITQIGSIEQIRFRSSPGVFSGDMLDLAAMPNLRVLDLSGCEVTDTFLTNLGGAANLRDLRLQGEQGLTAAGVQAVGSLTGLARLALESCEIEDTWLQHLAGLDALTFLDLSGNGPFTATGLAELQAMIQLAELDVSSCGIANAALGELALLPSLAWLNLNSNTTLTQQGIDLLRSSASLRTLHVRGCGANGAWLATMGLFTALEELSIDGSFADTFLGDMTGMTGLRRLAISSGQIGNPGMLHLRSMTWIESLDLTGTAVGDGGLGHLKDMPALKRLVMNPAGAVSPVGAARIAEMPALESLALGGASAGIGFTGLSSITLAGNLRSLKLNSSGHTDEDLRLLRRMRDLRVLELQDAPVNGGFVSTLVSSGVCIERLTMANCAPTAAGLRFLPQLRHLKRLNILGAGVADRTSLDRFATCAHLERLSLVGLTTDSSLATEQGLRNLNRLARLERLDLSGTFAGRNNAIDFLRLERAGFPVRYGP